MTQPNIPVNPANFDTFEGAMREILRAFNIGIDSMLPARVIQYDRVKNRVSVQPLIKMISSDGTILSRAQISSLPVLTLGGGNFVINFNLNPGDLGWILAADRDISLFLQSGKENPPNTFRLKDFSSSLFVPDIIKKDYTIAPEDSNNMVIQSLDGTVKISLGSSKITIDAPEVVVNATTSAEVNAPIVTTNGNTDLNGGGSGVARIGDSVTITIINGVPATGTGIISSGSSTVKAAS